MLCRCHMNHNLHRMRRIFKTPLLFTLCRPLSTHSVCLFPRGYTRHEREMRILQQEEEVEVENVVVPPTAPSSVSTTTSNTNTHTHSSKVDIDTRPIDKVDPVIIKYVDMLNELRNAGKPTEKVNLTHFGSIRFDTENIPRVHGQFDTEFEVNVDEYLKDNVPGFNVKSQSEEMTDVNVNGREQDSDDIDINNYSGKNTSDVKEMNYIDEQMFSEPFYRYQKLNPQSNPSTEATEEKPNTAGQEQHKSDEGEPIHHDLNYIDDVFFKNSLENLSENRKPSVEYSVIKEQLESTLLNTKSPNRDDSEALKSTDPPVDLRKVMASVSESEEEGSLTDQKKAKEDEAVEKKESPPKSAYDYIVKKRQQEHQQAHGITKPSGESDPAKKSYQKILSLLNTNRKEDFSNYEMLKLLKNSIIYDQYDIVGLYKPYGLSVQPGTESLYHTLTDFLPDLATFLKTENLYPVHRLDSTTTGVMLLARTPAMADTLKMMFKNREMTKKYWAIVKGTPNPTQGIIDIPIAEGLIDSRRRMVLKPDIPGVKSTNSRSQYAVTSYKVLSSCSGVSMVEFSPKTGVKHQLRVHTGFGLSCPVLGDHKYSHFNKLAPQRLPGDTLQKLKLKQSRVRDLPMFLHSRSIVVPEVNEGRNVVVKAQLPAYFNKALSLLHLNRKGSQMLMEELTARA
ncbi:hypothetical protein Pmani_012942 [Petrolisthes manimaculis]|uniref:Pseudouridylate synthase RPUSD4, mitochondrial n=1 Tax=Petrolisthes manimaculis TaxID=1843537 RepID=A0AAE1UE47_9EUCA|nr:hypothetical protein Pmani_012942 [Petrolisthes manimaculis]